MRLAIVSNLVPDSPAAKAGVKEGDLIVSMTPKRALGDMAGKMMEMKVTRAGQPLTFNFSPYGPPQPGWLWVMSDGARSGSCKID
jgi:C-terminal processing protease CtpA/Prc